MNEQDLVAAELDASLENRSKPIDRAQRDIELIREYQMRLIADVVTGQLDVRQAARRLPDVEQPEGSVQSDLEDESEDLLEGVADDE